MNKSILFCTGIFPPQIGGPATYVLKMAQKMTQAGIKNAIITYSDATDQENYSLNVYRIPWAFFIFTYFKYFLTTLKIGKNYDILYIQGSFLEGLPTTFANFFLKKRTVIRIGGIFSWELSFSRGWTTDLVDDFLRKKQSSLPELLKKIDRFVISRCDKVLANSKYTKKLLELNQIDPSKIDIIYNSVDSTPLETISKEDYKKSINITTDKIILSVGRFVPWKNHDKLIEFSKELDDRFSVIIIGDGYEEEKLRTIISRNKLQNKVFIFNKLPKNELYKMYQIADIVTLISSFEGLSHVLIEAMRLNLPIIASHIEPNIEVLDGYAHCKIIPINKESFISAVYSINTISGNNNTNLEKYHFENIYQKTIKSLCA